MAGYGDPPVRAYDMHGPNTDYGIIQPYHGILQPALIHIIAQCKYESKYEYKFKYIPIYRSTNKYKLEIHNDIFPAILCNIHFKFEVSTFKDNDKNGHYHQVTYLLPTIQIQE